MIFRTQKKRSFFLSSFKRLTLARQSEGWKNEGEREQVKDHGAN